MAIVALVTIGTIMALSLAMTTQTAKRTTDIYLYEQAALLAKSAAELALERIAANPLCDPANNMNPSVPNISFIHDEIYNINIDIRYFLPTNYNCADENYFFNPTDPSENIRAHLYGTAMLDITVSIDDPTITSEPISYFRRTIQKL